MFKANPNLELKINSLPQLPGCYLYKNQYGKVIYVGKANRLKNRVKSYFTNYDRLDGKTKLLIRSIDTLDFVVVDNEAEALILETNLIKKHKPKFNRMKMDDKNYSWIEITNEDFPRIKIVRQPKSADIHTKKKNSSTYLGPYNDTFPIKEVIKKLRKLWNFRTCNRTMYLEKSENGESLVCSNPKPCLYFNLGLCKAPCAGQISSKEYKNSINNIKLFLGGKKREILIDLENEMKVAAKELDFEKAIAIRDKVNNIKYVLNKVNIGSEVDDKLIDILKQQERVTALNELLSAIDMKEIYQPNFRIECFDISNIQGKFAVGAMTVMENGQLNPNSYRKFKIRSKDTPDDPGMMKEMLIRRLKYIQETSHTSSEIETKDKPRTFGITPNLIIIDGGKTQLSRVEEAFQSTEICIPYFGLAKKFEEIILPIFVDESPKGRKIVGYKTISLRRKSEALRLIQRLRDESHRFGITYHRKLRSSAMLIRKS